MLIAAEEPEIHLHPNAQRALMAQLKALSHQFIVSTHSPYVASVCEPHEFRSMLRVGENIDVRWLPQNIDPAETRAIKRLILRFRGESLFATGLIFELKTLKDFRYSIARILFGWSMICET